MPPTPQGSELASLDGDYDGGYYHLTSQVVRPAADGSLVFVDVPYSEQHERELPYWDGDGGGAMGGARSEISKAEIDEEMVGGGGEWRVYPEDEYSYSYRMPSTFASTPPPPLPPPPVSVPSTGWTLPPFGVRERAAAGLWPHRACDACDARGRVGRVGRACNVHVTRSRAREIRGHAKLTKPFSTSPPAAQKHLFEPAGAPGTPL